MRKRFDSCWRNYREKRMIAEFLAVMRFFALILNCRY